MKEPHVRRRGYVVVLGNIVLVLLGLAIALGSAEMLMRTFPNLVPSEVRVNPPARRVNAFVDESYDLRNSDGDLFYHMRGSIVPISPEQDRVIAHIHMITDANGFRNSPPEKTTYDIVALGDSFTRASGVALPWTQELAELTGTDVLNLADVGFGPQDELKVLQQYGLEKQPKWVILAYFEGNDLYDAAAYEQATPFILLRFGRYLLDSSIEAWHQSKQGETQVEVTSNDRYPVTVTTNDTDLEMAFFSYYIAWLSIDREVIQSSQNYRLVTETILKMQELSKDADARFMLVYVPSKEHVYLPYLNTTDILQRVFADVPTTELDQAGFLQFARKRATPELVRQYMDDQSHTLGDFAAEHHILFLDLTPVFQKEADTGTALYYAYDTHWSQLGHDLAAQSIYEYAHSRP